MYFAAFIAFAGFLVTFMTFISKLMLDDDVTYRKLDVSYRELLMARKPYANSV